MRKWKPFDVVEEVWGLCVQVGASAPEFAVCTGSGEVGRFGLLSLPWSLSFQTLPKGVSEENCKASINRRESEVF